MNDDQQQLDALTQLETALADYQPAEGFTTLAVDAEAVDIGELCELYRQYKRYLEIGLGLIERIPIYGRKIAKAIRFLMTIADQCCPR